MVVCRGRKEEEGQGDRKGGSVRRRRRKGRWRRRRRWMGERIGVRETDRGSRPARLRRVRRVVEGGKERKEGRREWSMMD